MNYEATPTVITSDVPHPARRYNYWLGGKDNFAADRESADAIEAAFPHIRTAAKENRRFLQRAVRHLTQEHGIRQFLDIGTGLPTADNTHEVAQAVDPACRVVYVDNDQRLPGSMHTWLILLEGEARGTRGRVRTGQYW